MGKARTKVHNVKTSQGNRRKPVKQNSQNGEPLRDAAAADVNHSVPSKPKDLSQKFDILFKHRVGGLLIAQLNVQKIGKLKCKLLSKTLKDLRVDCLAIVEHHLPAGDYEPDQYSYRQNHPTMKINGFKHASKHRDKASGGVAWFWRKDLNVETWEGAPLPNNLHEAGRERGWIKVQCKNSQIALGVAYLPTENSGDANNDKYQQILDVLSLDCNLLEKDQITNFIFGDFNAHVGTPNEHPLGIKGNKPKLGYNGQRLLLWCQSLGKILVNSQPITEGL